MKLPMTSIIIPSRNGLRLLQRCVASIRERTDPAATPYEVIIADDASVDGTAEWCASENLTFVRLPRPAGFPAACNRGLRLAAGDQLLLLNNDTAATNGWLANMQRALQSDERIGLVGPVTNYADGKQRIAVPFADLAEFQRVAAQMNEPDSAKWEPAQRIIGFCMLFKRTVYDRLGGMDERFGPGHYEDDDYCFRARMHGFGIRICRDTLVYHEGTVSFRQAGEAELQALVERNRRRFTEKWGIDPLTYHES